MAEIDSLQIQIQADAAAASSSLNALKTTLEGLKSACGGALPSNLQKISKVLKSLQGVGKFGSLSGEMDKAAAATDRFAKSATNAGKASSASAINLMALYVAASRIGRGIASLIKKSNEYVEDLNLFNASLGQFAGEAQQYADRVASVMGIDPAKWMRNQGIFQTLATGFGVASDRAYIMSKNLTQLGYDLSSFFNIAVDGEGGSMQKLQAAISGELEPLRRLGFDLSQAKLQATALSLGIDETVTSMNQAEKAQLRYYAILNQVTTAQGDMARTLDTPANQLRIFKAQLEQAGRAIGNIFIPALNAILPVAIAAAQVIRMVADAIASLFGFALPTIDYSGIDSMTGAVDSLDESLQSAGGSAKKLNELLADWDELNIIQSESGRGGGGGSALDTSDWAFELPEYDFLKGLVDTKVSKILEEWKPTITWIKDNIEEILSLAEGVGAAFGAWKLSKMFLGDDLKLVNTLLGRLLEVVGGGAIAYLTIKLNTSFTNKWLNEGDWGALVGGTLTDVAGATLAGKLVEHALRGTGAIGESLGSFTRGATLIITASTTLEATLDHIEKKGFDYTSVLSLLKSGGEMAFGAAGVANALALAISGTTSPFLAGLAAVGALVYVYLRAKLAEVEFDDTNKGVYKYGSKTLDEAGMQDLVNSWFTYDVQAHVDSLTAYTDANTKLFTQIGSQVQTMQTSITGLKLGLDVDGSVEQITGLLGNENSNGDGTLIGNIRAHIEQSRIPIKLFFTGDDISTEGEQQTMSVLDFIDMDVSGELGVLGKQWGELIGKPLTDEVKAEMMAVLDYISALSDAYIKAELQAKMDIAMADLNLEDLNRETVLAVLDRYAELQSEVWQAYKQQEQDSYTEMKRRLAAEQVVLANTSEDDPMYQRRLEAVEELAKDVAELKADMEGRDGETPYSRARANFDLDMAASKNELVQAMGNMFRTQEFFDLFAQNYSRFTQGTEITTQAEAAMYVKNLASNPQWMGDIMDSYFGTDVWNRIYSDLGHDWLSGFSDMFTEYIMSIYSGTSWYKQLPENKTVGPAWQQETPPSESWYNDIYTWWYPGGITDDLIDKQVDKFNELVTIYNSLEEGEAKNALGKARASLGWAGQDLAKGDIETYIADMLEYENLWQQYIELTEEPVAPTLDTSSAELSIAGMQTSWNSAIQGMNSNNVVSLRINTSYSSLGIPDLKFNFHQRAEGGFPDMGELFVAREAGPELVGRIGKHTAVANNEQIEEGISQGVRSANGEQNDLLRQQNQLLRAILSKTGRGLEPSTALARTVKRSNEMLLQADGR